MNKVLDIFIKSGECEKIFSPLTVLYNNLLGFQGLLLNIDSF